MTNYLLVTECNTRPLISIQLSTPTEPTGCLGGIIQLVNRLKNSLFTPQESPPSAPKLIIKIVMNPNASDTINPLPYELSDYPSDAQQPYYPGVTGVEPVAFENSGMSQEQYIAYTNALI